MTTCNPIQTTGTTIRFLQNEMAGTFTQLTNAIKNNLDLCENNFKDIECQFISTNNKVDEQKQSFNSLLELAQSDHDLISQLSIKLASMESRLSQSEKELLVLRNLVNRQPSGEIIPVEFNGNRSHHFKEYKSPDGLTRPHRHSHDFILGDRWIDLAEPLD